MCRRRRRAAFPSWLRRTETAEPEDSEVSVAEVTGQVVRDGSNAPTTQRQATGATMQGLHGKWWRNVQPECVCTGSG